MKFAYFYYKNLVKVDLIILQQRKCGLNASNLTSIQSFPLLGEVVLLKFISTLQKEHESCNEESFVSNINSVALKTKELLRYHCGYHGNIVTIATGKLGYASSPNEALCQI